MYITSPAVGEDSSTDETFCTATETYRPNIYYSISRMTYSELIDKLSEELGLTKTETRTLVKTTVSECTEQLGQGNGFSIPDLGTFTTRVKEVQKVYNPHYDKYLLVPPKRVVEFSPAKSLKEGLKFSRPEENE
ncbi:MAG: HU family DNA-binding protein [Balneolaceae bacterium]